MITFPLFTRRRAAVAAAIAGTFLTLCLIVCNPSRSCPLSIQFVGYTNNDNGRHATFIVTNRSAIKQTFHVLGQTAHNSGGWEEYSYYGDRGIYDMHLDPGGSAQFSIYVFGHAPCRLVVLWAEPDSRWRQPRWRWRLWLEDHNLPRVARFLSKGYSRQLIIGPEVQE
jgi:hypothetical protein